MILLIKQNIIGLSVHWQRTLILILIFISLTACISNGSLSTETTHVGVASSLVPTEGSTSTPTDLSIILGRPTFTSITISLLSNKTMTLSIDYGTEPGKYNLRYGPIHIEKESPLQVELDNLLPDTEYYYSINGIEHTFHTARQEGSGFTFTIDADPHNQDPRFNSALYLRTLTNALSEHPDFHIDLGDTFMTEKLQPNTYQDVENSIAEMRPFFGILNSDAALYLVNGNHEGELGWLRSGKDASIPVWSTEARQLYFPNPVPGNFYSGAVTVDPLLDAPRDGYYSWTWGDALFIVLDPFWYTLNKPSKKIDGSNWNWTLGREQYDWLKNTLETSNALYKFVFIHHLVGGSDEYARGGIEFAHLWEWGGMNPDGTFGFDEYRPGWGIPIHQLFVQNKVSAVFHGHDHVYVTQELDGIVYQELPQPSNAQSDNHQLAAEYGYNHGTVIPGSGHLRVTITPEKVTVSFILASLDYSKNGQEVFSYTIPPQK
jgi:hypothetical protein